MLKNFSDSWCGDKLRSGLCSHHCQETIVEVVAAGTAEKGDLAETEQSLLSPGHLGPTCQRTQVRRHSCPDAPWSLVDLKALAI